MRTTIDLPDPLLRQLKSCAALQGTTLKALVLDLVERGLEAPPATPRSASRAALPSISVASAFALHALQTPSNAGLFDLLDDA